MKPRNIPELFFPRRCPGCDSLLNGDFPLCDKCREKLIHPSPKKSRCDICFMSQNECICKGKHFFEKLCVPLYYQDSTKHVLHRFKFRSRRDLAKAYGELLIYSLKERDMLSATDIITFIPMFPVDKFLRGYNQSELIARYISQKTGIPCVQFLRKVIKTKNQHSLGKIHRSGNLLGAFEPDKKQLDLLQGKRILMVDDIITTGSTLNENAKTLLIFGAGKVYACACAITKIIQKKH